MSKVYFSTDVRSSQDPLNRVLQRLRGVRQCGNGWGALCPAHDDRHQSLSISEGSDGRVLLKCHAGCDIKTIVRALGLELRELFPPKPSRERKAPKEKRIVATYRYVDESGKLLFEVVRYDPKEFSQRRPDGKGGWIYNINGVRRVLYRLPDVLKAVQAGETVYICEGEKDCNNLGALGLTATTNPHGAGKWRDEYSDSLRGAHVVIIPDNDDAGRRHAEAVANSLWGKAKSIKIVELDGDGVKDVSDWLAAGGTREQLLKLVESASEWQPQEGPHQPQTQEQIALDEEFTDRNNALILARLFKEKAYWVPQWGWMLWTGARWERDSDGSRVLSLARELLPTHYLEKALQTSDYKEREKLCDYAKRAHRRSNLTNALELAKGDLLADPKDFDVDPWLLNCENGVLDLRTGELRPHSADLKLTKICAVAYNPDAKAPTWEKFLSEIFLGDQELTAYVQRACGYSITGDVREDKLFICWGTGANGKSTMLQTLRRVLGDYGGAIAPAAIVTKGKDTHPTAVADLHGLRFAIAIETEEDQRLAEAQVKALTGRDSIKARFLHRDYFEFEPRAKIWLATNHRPLIRDTSPAIWRRIALIPFRAFFPPERQDKTLGEKLWQEREGILAWLVKGCFEWQQQGLGGCNAVAEATEIYRSEMDTLQDWLETRCVPDPRAVTPFKDLYDDYVAWCQDMDQDPLGKRAFANRLTEKGFENARVKGEAKARRGLRLRGPTDRTDRSDQDSEVLHREKNFSSKISELRSDRSDQSGTPLTDEDDEVPF